MFLTEAALQLSVAAIGAAVMFHTTNSLIDDALATGTGQYMSNVASAVNTYVFDNMTVLAASPSGPTTINAGSISASVASPLHPTVQDLINLKLLPIGFSDTSPLGVSFAIDLVPTNCSSGLTNCTIPGRMYSTTAYRDSSGRIRTDQMASVVAAAGVDAGVSYAETPTVITGMAASWSAPNPLSGGNAGVLMMRVGNTSLLAQSMNQFYKRDGSLNLTGPMDANNQAMNAVGNLQSNGSVSANGNVSAGAQVSGNTVTGNYLRSNGDAGIAGNASANAVYGNYVQSNGNVTAVGTMTANTLSGNAVTSAGNVSANGYLYAGGALVPSVGGGQQVSDGQGCWDPQGAIRSDPNGRSLSCQNGFWRAASGTSDGNVVSGASYCEAWCYTGICVTRAGAGGRWNSGSGSWVCAPGTEFIATSSGSLPSQGSGG
ncbi:shufflon system plasmid conjugative transfer pilus tip adhesin PilV [Cupriavidus basilensis]|uniref:shufflon system plasmid conjugative transfer pilus tip adhesin PilV n=1 Tax=Cupriavidus basilensis TaxID=68895 RepID=UPI0020A69C48|nr:shufflon system plasmid conjugative transfer pilus tip adhesin PilV [Cupriavidus basilensis]MCP3018263.1 shufflon system plasmid conjugative transfer pilus tip adhesin PilV [Cupriavidus basilensis]